MKKLITIFAVIAIILSLGSAVYAEETYTTTEVTTIVDAVTKVEETVTESHAIDTTTEETPESAAAWIVNGFIDNLDKILAGVAGVISMVVLVIQKVSIIPKQDAFVTNTSNTFSAFVSDINTFRGDMKSNADNMKTDVVNALNTINSVIKNVEELQRQQKESSTDRQALATALSKEADMLNMIIQASTMAQWKKDEVGEMHKEVQAVAKSLTPIEDGEAE